MVHVAARTVDMCGEDTACLYVPLYILLHMARGECERERENERRVQELLLVVTTGDVRLIWDLFIYVCVCINITRKLPQ